MRTQKADATPRHEVVTTDGKETSDRKPAKSGAKKKNGKVKSKKAGKKARKKAARKAADPSVALDAAKPSKAAGVLTAADMAVITSKSGLLEMMRRKKIDTDKVLWKIRYEQELERLQIELVKLQRTVQAEGRRVAIVCEGRDAAGKGGTIRRFMEHLNPRAARIVALPKPTYEEKGQWYFRRYIKALPNPGEICFFDRSWYNRAVVEPVMGFCDKGEYRRFMRQVPEFEHMLYEDGLELIKFWFSISKDEQKRRFDARRVNPLKQWKLSPVDEVAQQRWDDYTKYKERMFATTHTTFSPWIIVRANVKRDARLESIRYALSRLDYEGKDEPVTHLQPDPAIVRRFHRSVKQID